MRQHWFERLRGMLHFSQFPASRKLWMAFLVVNLAVQYIIMSAQHGWYNNSEKKTS